MNTIDILIEGYVRITENGWIASATTVLITSDNNKKILVDPGANRKVLLDSLNQRNILVENIDYIFLTHHHLDHAGNVALFPNAKIVDFEAILTNDQGEVRSDSIPNTDIQILLTPGHEYGHASLVVPTNEGNVVISGDVFYWEEGEEQVIDVEKHDDFATDMEALKESRRKVLEAGKWIIPGHGKKFFNSTLKN